jgi:hypothetical protein
MATVALNFCDHALAALADKTFTVTDEIERVPLRESVESELEEYEVYSALMDRSNDGRSAKLVVINEQTSVHAFNGLDELLKEARQNVPEIEDQTLDDFQAKNRQPHRLKNLFRLHAEKISLASQQEIESYFGEGGGWWRDFYARYPQADGFWTLSRIGFNADRTQALAYFGHSCGDLCGNGGLLFLGKEHGTWKVKGGAGFWIS